MDMAKMLAGRTIQPGSKPFGKPAHDLFEKVVKENFPDYTLVPEPRFFKQRGYWAMVPDYSLVIDGRAVFFEIKRQGKGGNAHERLYKNFTTKKMREIQEIFDLDHYPLYGILCDELAVNPRYTREFEQNLDEDNYLLWVDYQPEVLVDFIEMIEALEDGIELKNLTPLPPV